MAKVSGSAINFGNQSFVLQQLEIYLKNPEELDPEWSAFFKGMEFASSSSSGISDLSEIFKKEGHLVATVNPMKEPSRDLSRFQGDGELQKIYCGNTSYECYNIENKSLENWFHQEVQKGKGEFTSEQWEGVVKEFFKAKYLEEFLQKNFLGAKRFSLEGGESFMPMMHALFECAANAGYQTGVIGMAHRGRLNVLCNLLKKPYSKLFKEFNTKVIPDDLVGLGDVKYHKGYTSLFHAKGGETIELSLLSNPSHLESIDPVVLGYAKGLPGKTLPVMIHGDASVAGQGVVYETLQCSNLKGYSVGGTLHIVINNQVGFTAEPEESRSTRYCTDIAKGFGIPVIHVNAEDAPACVRAVELAFEVRDRFASDVFIDLNCMRVYGHNEADEPRFTNPLLYKKIAERGDLYEKLKNESRLDPGWITSMENAFKAELEKDQGT